MPPETDDKYIKENEQLDWDTFGGHDTDTQKIRTAVDEKIVPVENCENEEDIIDAYIHHLYCSPS